MGHRLRPGRLLDLEEIHLLLPGLASFELPQRRRREDLWEGDAKLIAAALRGEASQCRVRVAENVVGEIVGVAALSLRPEMLSHAPSAHLEVIVISPAEQGTGLGRALLEDIENVAREEGALTLTLHVFARNTRAVRFYERAGYDGEIVRHIKDL